MSNLEDQVQQNFQKGGHRDVIINIATKTSIITLHYNYNRRGYTPTIIYFMNPPSSLFPKEHHLFEIYQV